MGGEYYAENPDKKPVEKMKERSQEVVPRRRKFQADTDARTAFDSRLSRWMERRVHGYLGAVKGEDETTQVQDFHRGNRSRR